MCFSDRFAIQSYYHAFNNRFYVHCTRSKLEKLHCQFRHPAAYKLFNFIKRKDASKATPEVLKMLKDIDNKGALWQRIRRTPTIFKVSFSAKTCRFNERVMMDLMWIGTFPRAALQIVDDDTRFSEATLFPDKSTKTIWEKLLV